MGSIAFKTLGGDGPDVVLIHGFGSDRLSWLATSPALLEVARVHALDLPGHGESAPEVGDGSAMELAGRVVDRLTQEGLELVHLVGHSLGGGIALLIAARRPDLVASLSLLAPAGLGGGIDAAFPKDLAALGDVDSAMALLRRLVVRGVLINRMTAKRLIDHLARDGVRKALASIAAALPDSETAIREAAAKVTREVPRLVVWGEADSINPLDQARLDSFGGESHVIPATAHLPHIENPAAVNAVLCAFLARARAS